MPDPTPRFHVGDILSITTGKLVSPDHIDGVYRVLNHMTGDSLYTHQLPLASDAVLPDIREQHPWTAEVTPPERFASEAHVHQWVAEQAARYGEWHDLTPVPQAWGSHDPIADFTRQYPGKRMLVVEMPDGGEGRG